MAEVCVVNHEIPKSYDALLMGPEKPWTLPMDVGAFASALTTVTPVTSAMELSQRVDEPDEAAQK